MKNLKMVSKDNKQELFLSLFCFNSIIIFWLITFFVWLISPRFDYFNYQGNLTVDILRIVFIIISIFIVSLFISIYFKLKVPLIHLFLDLIIKSIYPMIYLMGRILGFSTKMIQTSFISVNNNIIKNEKLKFEHKDILIIIGKKLENSYSDHKLENLNEEYDNKVNSEMDDIIEFCKETEINYEILDESTQFYKRIIKYKLILSLADLDEVCQIIKKASISNRIYGMIDFDNLDKNNYRKILESTYETLV